MKTGLLILLTISACLLVHSVQATDVYFCNKRYYSLRVSDVVISPDPVETGKPTTFTFNASTEYALCGGEIFLDVSYLGEVVHEETYNVCDKVSCPVAAGDFELSLTQTLPIDTPPGLYRFTMEITNTENHLITCIRFDFTIGSGQYESI